MDWRASGLVFLTLALPGTAWAAPIPVSSPGDAYANDGECTLREAISAANANDAGPHGDCSAGSGADAISLPAGTYSLARAGASEDANATGDLDVSSAISITGAGTATTTIDGAAIDRVLDISGGGPVTLKDLTITGGHAPAGSVGSFGGAQPAGVDSVGGNGGAGAHGGGIRNTATVLTLDGTTVTGNQAGAGGAAGFGGTAGAGGTVPAGAARAGNAGAGGDGGGIWTIAGAQVTLTDSRVEGNDAGAGGAGGYGGQGGDTIGATDGTGQSAHPGGESVGGPGGAGGSGGGLWAEGGAVTLVRSTIASNDAGPGGHGGDGGEGGEGGSAIDAGTGGSATGGAGGVGGSGGGMFLIEVDASVDRSELEGNKAGRAGDGGDGGTGGAGGDSTGTTSGNAGDGGSTAGGDAGTGGAGGGIDAETDGDLFEIEASTLAGNSAGGGGEGGAGGTRGLAAPLLDIDTTPGTNGAARGGDAGDGGDGGGINQFGAREGGPLTNVTISGNLAGFAGFGGSAGEAGSVGGDGGTGGRGGGLLANSSTGITLLHATLVGNSRGGGGSGGSGSTSGTSGGVEGAGGVDGLTPSSVTVTNSVITTSGGPNCESVVDGGNNQSPSNCPGATGGASSLGPLAGNGGTTPTHRPATNSPALDLVPAGEGCAETDQRGASRPGGSACDAGAFELRPPVVQTGAAVAVLPTTARLTATVDPGGLPAASRFEYGKTTAYGAQVAAPSNAASSAAIAGLEPSTTYHFRIVSANIDGTTNGVDRTFTTAAVPTGGGGTPPPPSPLTPVQPAPVIGAVGARPDRRGRVTVSVRCPRTSPTTCRGRLTLRAGGRAIGRARISIAAGQTKKLRVKLSRRGRTLLRKRGRLRVAVTATANGKSAKRSVTLRRRR